MGFQLLVEGAALAVSVGMGCGTCCGSSMGVILSGYLMTHAKNFGESFMGFLAFYLGKITAVMALCGMAAYVGEQIMDAEGYIGAIPVEKMLDVMMVAMAVWFILKWFKDIKGESEKQSCSCSNCSHVLENKSECNNGMPYKINENITSNKPNIIALWLMGAGYGISPCAPLIMMLGYSVTLPIWIGAAVGGVFAMVSAISPMLILLLLSGVLAGKAYMEMPRYLKWFRLFCYILMIVFFGKGLL